MRKIDFLEQREILINILKYFDEICRNNNINYSLIGGSLIGSIRHKGMIPWDDDIDVILSRDNYFKIIEIIEKDNNSRYKVLTNNNTSDYYFPFAKIIDKKTLVVEPLCLDNISEYGIFIDLFCYNFVPDDKKIKIVKKIKLYNSMLSRKKLDIKNENIKQNVLRFFKNLISKILGYKIINKQLEKIYEKNSQLNSNYVVSNWPIYRIDKEIQKAENINEYIDAPFENLTVRIFKNYDEILRTTYGDYMKLPPENERYCHGLEAYWRDENEEK